mmetsp:Transcript_60495/g.144145  ORF Transcript_60495/g.144145 Transcript_60495/m.144145 type:complete len:752 (-) Transcript_60495:250-2505(-)
MFKRLLTSVGFGELPSSFGYNVGEKVEIPFNSLWELHKGQRRSDGQAVSIFVCAKKDLEISQVSAAKNAEQMSKSLRHPNILRAFDSCETEGGIYIATEEVEPMLAASDEADEDREANVWGLYQALDALSFLHTSGFTHGLFGPASIFVTRHGDYRLGSFELCRKEADSATMLGARRKLGPGIARWPEPPAALGSGGAPSIAIDLWGAAVLSAYVFSAAKVARRGVNMSLDLNNSSQDIPPELRKVYVDLQKVQPLRGRSPIAEFVNTPYLQENASVRVMLFLSSLHIRSPEEKDAFFEALPSFIENIPRTMQTKQVLKELLEAQKFPGQEAAQVLPAILKIGVRLKDDEFKEKIQPLVVKLFTSPDRAVRFRLLSSIGDMINNLDDVMINDKIFPECVNGFTDSCAPIREATVKSMVFFVPRLKAKTVNDRILKLLIKTLSDPEASIRTNSVICCGRISSHLPKEVANQTLGQALSIGLKDPFGPCRAASLRTLLATATLFSPEDLAMKLMPSLCQRLVDPEPSVADVAFEVLTSVQKHLRQQVEQQRAAQAATQDAQGSAAADAVKAASAGSWGSWAFSTVASQMGQKLAGSMMSSGSLANASSAASSGDPTSPSNQAPAPPAAISGPSTTAVASTSSSQRNRTSTGGGMSIAGKASNVVKPNAKPEPSFGMEEATAADAGDAWGQEDDFWDDFGDMSDLAPASVGEQKEKAPAVAATPSPVKSTPAAAKPKPVIAAEPKAVPKVESVL